MTVQSEALRQAARRFREATTELQIEWEKVQNTDEDSEALIEDYAFADDFDEVAARIRGWLNEEHLREVEHV